MTSQRILLLHGIETCGANNLGLLGDGLENRGFCVELLRLRRTRWYNSRRGSIIQENIRRVRAAWTPGAHLLAHSNGVRLGWHCMREGMRFGNCFFFNGALDSTVDWPEEQYRAIYNIHNRADRALIPALITPLHEWGGIGRRGYRGDSPSIINVEDKSRNGLFSLNHSNWAAEPELTRWVDFVAGVLKTLCPEEVMNRG